MQRLVDRWRLLVLLVPLVVLGCDRNRQTGRYGELTFEYYSRRNPGRFDKPIIRGGFLELYVWDAARGRRVEILEARSTDPETGRVEGTAANLVVVQGLDPGRASFRVRARDAAGEIRVDVISLRVDAAVQVNLRAGGARAVSGEIVAVGRTLRGESKLTATTGSRIEIPWVRRNARGEPLVGFGVYPVAIVPPDAAKLHDRRVEDDTVTLSLPDRVRTFELIPARTCRGNRLIIETVDGGATAGASGANPAAVERHGSATPVSGAGPPRFRGDRSTSIVRRILVEVVICWLVSSVLAALFLCWSTQPPVERRDERGQ